MGASRRMTEERLKSAEQPLPQAARHPHPMGEPQRPAGKHPRVVSPTAAVEVPLEAVQRLPELFHPAARAKHAGHAGGWAEVPRAA